MLASFVSYLAAVCVLIQRENSSYVILLTTRSVAYFEYRVMISEKRQCC